MSRLSEGADGEITSADKDLADQTETPKLKPETMNLMNGNFAVHFYVRWHSHSMQKLRSMHLYLGCVFAPLLLFFAISGIWQMLGLHSDFLDHLSTIHTSRQMKDGSGLSSRLMVVFVFIMALSFIVTTILGVVMAVKYGRNRKAAFYCLALGVILPGVMVLVRVFGEHKSLIREF